MNVEKFLKDPSTIDLILKSLNDITEPSNPPTAVGIGLLDIMVDSFSLFFLNFSSVCLRSVMSLNIIWNSRLLLLFFSKLALPSPQC